MKTIAVPRTPRTIFTTALVLGGLAALYFYRRNGGKYSTLMAGAVDTFGKVKERLTSTAVDAKDTLEDAQTDVQSRRPMKEISTSPEAMDSLASN